MGLLDWAPDDEDLALPCFDSSFAPAVQSVKPVDDSFNSWSFKKAQGDIFRDRSDSIQSDRSTSSTDIQDNVELQTSTLASACVNIATSPTTATSNTTMAKKSKKQRKQSQQSKIRPRQRRQSSFDLFGDDSELQDAESKISFCDICLKQCDVH